jgi:hypothetical protein
MKQNHAIEGMTMSKRRTIDLKELFFDFQKEMTTSLKTTRKHIHHPTTKGDGTEFKWTEWLNKYLPKRYKTERAIVVDINGDLSEAIDLVIFDRQYSPFILNHNNNLYIPAESVYAVIEVKQDLTGPHISYAGEKAASVRKLVRTSAPIYYVDGVYKPKKLGHILSGILCVESTWDPPFGTSFEKALSSLKGDMRLDIGCCIMSGAFEVRYKKKSLLLSKSHEQDSLLFFFLKLLSRLQELGTVPAIDLEKYMAVLKMQQTQKKLKCI